jgi:hypothetical protein
MLGRLRGALLGGYWRRAWRWRGLRVLLSHRTWPLSMGRRGHELEYVISVTYVREHHAGDVSRPL